MLEGKPLFLLPIPQQADALHLLTDNTVSVIGFMPEEEALRQQS